MDQVGILNLALGWLGCSPITDTSDESRPAQLLVAAWPTLRDALLEERDWSFATGRLALDLDPTAPVASSYPSRYLLPGVALRVLRAWPGNEDTSLQSVAMVPRAEERALDWQIEAGVDSTGTVQRYIVAETECNPLFVKAILRGEDPTLWSAAFCVTLAARLAAECCIAITENRTLSEELWKLYAVKLEAAAANDGRQGASPRIISNYLKGKRA